jgi:hypothetical protein
VTKGDKKGLDSPGREADTPAMKNAIGCGALVLVIAGSAAAMVGLDTWAARRNPEGLFVGQYYAAINGADYDRAMSLICPSARRALAASVRRHVVLRQQSGEPCVVEVSELERLGRPIPISELHGSALVALSCADVRGLERVWWHESIRGTCLERIEGQPWATGTSRSSRAPERGEAHESPH